MNFQESSNYLYSLGNEVLAMKLGLENVGKLLDAFGNPEENYLKIQVAGTNGKGSVCAFLEAICVEAGIATGTTTSPHLVSVTERVKINGREISETDFARHATIVRETAEKLVEEKELETVPTYFEQVTAIALNAFAEAKVELTILETGLGGRFDATTAANAQIAAITPIDYDHQNILGNTLAEIAAEKAAIIRAAMKVVVAEQLPEAMKVILERCAEFDISPNLASKISTICITEPHNDKIRSNFVTSKADYGNVRVNLSGRHQIENAKTAILLAEILQENFNITTENIVAGLETATHHGRLEFYKNILFDGAHNISGAKALKNYLDEFVEKPITMIFGAMRDKDLSEIAAILFPLADKLILTVPDNPRALETAELLKFVPPNVDKKEVMTTKTAAEALEIAENISGATNLICVTGSLYLVGEARKVLNN